MKKYWKLLTMAIVGAFVLNSCDDVPAPYPIPVTEGDVIEEQIEPEGNGTLTTPYNVAKLNDLIDKNQAPTGEIYIKGIVSSIKSLDTSKYPRAQYYISDNGKTTNQFYVYNGLYLDGANFTSDDQLKVGDEVVILGSLTTYNDKYQVNQNSKIISINGEGGSGDTPTPTPTPTGENLLANGDFELWANDLPTHWKSASAAGNASLSQEADDVHGGDFAVAIAGVASANKRMAYEEITLKAGTYKFSLFAKSTTTDKSQTRVGYVTVVNGTADSQGYKYGDYVNLNNNDWTECSTTFTLTAQTTICLVVMNPKTNGEYSVAQTILVDDASLVTSDGGIADGDDSGDDSGDGNAYTLATSITNGTYLMAANTENSTYLMALDLGASKTYGYLSGSSVTATENVITTDLATAEWTITAVTGGYTIKDSSGRFLAMKGTFNSFNVYSTESESYIWSISIEIDGTATITNVEKNKYIQYSTQHSSWGSYSTESGIKPKLFKK